MLHDASETSLSNSLAALSGLNELGAALERDATFRSDFVKDPINAIGGTALDFPMAGQESQMFSDYLDRITLHERLALTYFATGSDPSIGDCEEDAMAMFIYTYGFLNVNTFANLNIMANANINTNLHINTQAISNAGGHGNDDVA